MVRIEESRAWEFDTEFRESVVEKVESTSRGWNVTHGGGWTLFVTSEWCQVRPQPGESMRCYGRGIGYVVRGVVIGDRVYRYTTAAEEKAQHEEQQRKLSDEKEQKEADERADRDARTAALPGPLRDRMLRFQRSRDWRVEFEPYELFVCEEAAKIARHCGTAEAVAALAKAPWEEQKVCLDSDHSGNTTGAAFTLAHTLLAAPENVPKVHGAMCPLTGCKAYGCWAAEKES